jgi:hypothetical protein
MEDRAIAFLQGHDHVHRDTAVRHYPFYGLTWSMPEFDNVCATTSPDRF